MALQMPDRVYRVEEYDEERIRRFVVSLIFSIGG